MEMVSFPTQRADNGALIMCDELSRPISEPWPAPRREQKADLHDLMSGSVCFLTTHMKNEKYEKSLRANSSCS